jgi:hypothetical protein
MWPDITLNRLLSTILIVALGCLIGIVAIGPSYMPEGNISSYLSGLWTHSEEGSGQLTSSVHTQADLPRSDLGQLSGSVTDRGGQPIEDASIVIYMYGGLISSVDKQGGYTTITSSDKQGMYSFGALPSGVYNIKITNLNEIVSTIDNYAVWPSSSLSFNFVE